MKNGDLIQTCVSEVWFAVAWWIAGIEDENEMEFSDGLERKMFSAVLCRRKIAGVSKMDQVGRRKLL